MILSEDLNDNNMGIVGEEDVQINLENCAFDQKEVLMLIADMLSKLGYRDLSNELQSKAGIKLEASEFSHLRSCLESGRWSEAILQLEKCPGLIDDQKREIRYLISEQNFIELLIDGKIDSALDVLRLSITPNVKDHAKINSLAKLIMESQTKILKLGDKSTLIDRISKVTGYGSFFPSCRWNELFCQAIKWQISQCRPHLRCDFQKVYSLLRDHSCKSISAASIGHFVIPPDICTEIHYMKFSPDGRTLVTSGKYGMIYFLNATDNLSFNMSIKYESHDISCVSFEPTGRRIVICNSKGDVAIHEHNKLENHRSLISGFTCVEWLNAQNIFVGGQNHSLHLINQNGQKLYNWTEIKRTSQLILSRSGYLCCLNNHKNITIIDTTNRKIVKSITFEDKILSIAVSSCKAIISLVTNTEIRLHDEHTMNLLRIIPIYDKSLMIESDNILADTKKSNIVRYSSFCGYQDDLISLGCMDGSIKIWHCDSGKLMQDIKGYHDSIVTCISSFGANKIASADDDGNIYLWSLSTS